jgi:replication fork protection complex subunit Csm3/Swi3
MIEKLGHTKRIQTMRREWIEEEKPKLFRDDPEPTIETLELPTRLSSNQNQNGEAQPQAGLSEDADADQLFIPDPEADTRQQPTSHPEPDDDELDDLDDLLREQDDEMSGIQTSGPGPQKYENNMDDFDADYEAMNELGM